MASPIVAGILSRAPLEVLTEPGNFSAPSPRWTVDPERHSILAAMFEFPPYRLVPRCLDSSEGSMGESFPSTA